MGIWENMYRKKCDKRNDKLVELYGGTGPPDDYKSSMEYIDKLHLSKPRPGPPKEPTGAVYYLNPPPMCTSTPFDYGEWGGTNNVFIGYNAGNVITSDNTDKYKVILPDGYNEPIYPNCNYCGHRNRLDDFECAGCGAPT